MAGWESSDDIQIESVEEIIDTNPDLYKQRAIVAINECRYKDALKEAQLALKYGKQELQYHVLIVRTLLEMGQYEVCYNYLIGSKLWKNRKSEKLLPDERDYLYYTYARCFNECKFDVDKADFIVVTDDGKGMYSNIQTAIAYHGDSKKSIYLTKGRYNESICVIGQNIKIECDNIERAVITNPIQILKSNVKFENIEFYTESDMVMLSANDARCQLLNVIFRGKGKENKQTGIQLTSCKSINLKDTTFENLMIGVRAESKNVNIENCNVINNKIGVLCAYKRTYQKSQSVVNCTESQIEKNEIGICAACNSQVDISKTSFERNNDSVLCMSNSVTILKFSSETIEKEGVQIYPNKLNVFSQGNSGHVNIRYCEILNSKNTGIANCDTGNVIVTNCKIIGSSSLGGLGYGVYAKDKGTINLSNCLLENNLKAIHTEGNAIVNKVNVRMINNDIFGVAIEGAKGIVNAFKFL